MATARELLAAQSGEDRILTIDGDLRTISIPDGFGVFGVESDDDVLKVYFRGPRYYHDIDLSTFEIRVCITNAAGEPDMYPVKNMAIEEETDTIIFSWLIGRFTAQRRGTIEFSLCFREIDASTGKVNREFNTTTANGTILKGLETTEQIIQKNPDILEDLILRLGSLEENGIPASSLDTSLSVAGKAADAGAVGNALTKLASDTQVSIENALANLPTQPTDTVDQMVITLNSDTNKASHTFAQILEHINNGGSAVVKTAIAGYDQHLIPISNSDSVIVFANTTVGEAEVTQTQCGIWDTDTYTLQTAKMIKGISDEQAAQIQTNTDAIAEIRNPVKSGNLIIESNKYTMTLTMDDGSTETHVLETDENDYPSKLTVNGSEINWTTTEV